MRVGCFCDLRFERKLGRGKEDNYEQEARVESTDNDTGAILSNQFKENGPLHTNQ
jgi:hypothetical protein